MKKSVIFALALIMMVSFFSPAFAEQNKNSLVRFNGDASVERGESFDEVVCIFGNIDVAGTVNGDVTSIFGSIHLWPSAIVKGDLVSIGGIIATDPGASLTGGKTIVSIGGMGKAKMRAYAPFISAGIIGAMAVFGIITLACFILLAWLVLLFAGKHLKTVTASIEKHWLKGFFWGLLWLLILPCFTLLLVITVVGIPLIVVEAIVVSAAFVLGYIAVAGIIGRKALKMLRRKKITPLKETVWGIVILYILSMIPFVGGFIKCVASIAGFGAVVMTKFGYAKK